MKELELRAGGVAQVAEHLPSRNEGPDFKPQYSPKQKKTKQKTRAGAQPSDERIAAKESTQATQ
jgi:hypothetical protein